MCQGTGPDTDIQLTPTDAPQAAAAPSIREDRVEAARKAIDAATLGNDPQALPDKIIDRMLQ